MNWILKNKNSPREILMGRNFAGGKNISPNKKGKALLVALFLGVLLTITIPKSAHALVTETIAGGFETVIKHLLSGVNTVMGWLLSMAATLFAAVIDPRNISGTNGILNKQAVKDVWIMVRDILNMFFILVLLFSAFCTIFQVEKWNIKKVWLNILINALLVNFSFPIARIIIDISNVAMYYFINHMFSPTGSTAVNGSTIMASFADISKLSAILTPGHFVDYDIAYQIAMIVFTFILGVTLLVVAILFLIRLIALTMLIMFSPIGFVGYIFPSTASHADSWWKNLLSYSFFAPIMIFIMAISLQIAKAIGNENFQSFLGNAGGNTTGGEQASWIASAAFYTIPIIVLWMGMGVAKSMGIAGAETVVGGAQKFSKWAGKTLTGYRAGKWLAVAGAKKFERDVLAPRGLSPRAFMAGWKAKLQDAEDKALKPAAGAWRDRLNKTLSGEKTHYKDMEEENLLNKELKEMESYATNDAFLIEEIQGLKGKKDARSQAKAAAAIRMLFKNNDQNEFMKKIGMAGDGTLGSGDDRNPFTTKEALINLFGKNGVGMSEEQVGRNLYQLGEIALSKGNMADYGMGEYKDGKYQVSSNDSQQAATVAKFANLGSQEKMRSIHWNSILTETKEGEVGGVHAIGEALLNNITAAEVTQTNRARADFLQKMSDPIGRASLEAFMNNPAKCKNKENVKALLAEIDRLHDNDKKQKESVVKKELPFSTA